MVQTFVTRMLTLDFVRLSQTTMSGGLVLLPSSVVTDNEGPYSVEPVRYS
jgi:hypothetical protein